MPTPIVIITAIESGFGFLLTSTILYLVLLRGRKTYHYLFSAFLLICAIWDLGIFLLMIRNKHLVELEFIGRIAILPCSFIPALIFHFANQFTGRPIKWAVTLVWGLTGAMWMPIIMGIVYKIDGIYEYDWGNIFRVAPSILDPLVFIFWFGINLSACWLLIKGAKRAASRLERAHYTYIISGFLALTFAIVKALVTMGIDAAFILPLGMFLVDIFNAIIGLAIIKDRLFDITIVIKKGSLYSILAGLLIFIYSLSEHLLVTYIGETIGEQSTLVHFISIAVGIAVLIPVKKHIELAMDGYFAQKKFEF
ncbi:MAG: histidine kinase N-terminal 7TM domain-containing protein [Anaerolineales bacterium]